MNKHLRTFMVVMFILLLGLTTLFVFGSTVLPAYAQEGAGDQLLNQVIPLMSEGEGDDLVLSSNLKTLAPNEQHVYRFDYEGGEQLIRVTLNAIPAGTVQFQIWTDDLITALNGDPNLAPLAVGVPISEGSEFSVWQGNKPEAEIYYVTVRSTSADSAQYLLDIASAGLSSNQPGVVQTSPDIPADIPTETPTDVVSNTEAVTPVTDVPTMTDIPPVADVPPVETSTPIAPVIPESTPTAAPNYTVVPAAAVDPNVAVVLAPALNVRSGPSTAYAVITTVPAGAVLTVLGRNHANTWLAVRLEDGIQGWVTRSLTNYVGLATLVLTPEPLPPATSPLGVTATPTPMTAIVVGQPPTPEALDGDWKVIREGETQWYTFQYRGGGLPVHVWMDVEPDQGAVFNILNQETAQAILAGVAPTVVNAIGRGTANPVEPGYLFWRADFPEADIFYVMVQHEGPGDVLYSIHAAGPGLSRPVPQ